MKNLVERLKEMHTAEVGSWLAEVDEDLQHSYIYHPKFIKPLEYLRKMIRAEYHGRIYGRHYNNG